MNLNLDEESIRNIVRDVIGKMKGVQRAPSRPAEFQQSLGIFPDGASAAAAAREGYAQLCKGGIAARKEVVDIVKSMTVSNAKEWGAFEYNETKIGRLEDKIGKLEIVKLVPGVEWIAPDAYSGDNGIMLEEYAPYGVIGAITPVTHSVPTIAGNIINMVAAGNAVVFNPHPGGVKSAVMAISAYNAEIERRLGIRNLICCVGNPTLESFEAIAKSDDVAIMCITGGPGVVKAAMKSGKKSICAGPGNPPVIVDETADPKKAACDIIEGGAFDNNLLCIGEKEIFVTEAVFEKKNGGYALRRALVGKDPQVLARAAGAEISPKTKMLFAETDANHPFVIEEQMMPMVPVVVVKNFEEAVRAAAKAERNYRHSAIIHSLDVTRMTEMARVLNTTLFVKNGPSTAGLGLGGEGYLSYSIATATGEGISNPKTFTRRRRCVMVGNLNIF